MRPDEPASARAGSPVARIARDLGLSTEWVRRKAKEGQFSFLVAEESQTRPGYHRYILDELAFEAYKRRGGFERMRSSPGAVTTPSPSAVRTTPFQHHQLRSLDPIEAELEQLRAATRQLEDELQNERRGRAVAEATIDNLKEKIRVRDEMIRAALAEPRDLDRHVSDR